MAAIDIKIGKIQVTFMQPTVQQPRSSTDYKKIDFGVLAKYVHPIDKIEFQKQVGEMIYSTMTSKSMTMQKLQSSLDNITTQYKLEKASSQTKDNIIKSLEDLVIELGYNPCDVKGTKKLINKKNEDIDALKKQLKLPHS